MSRIEQIDPKSATSEAAELLAGVQSAMGMTPNFLARTGKLTCCPAGFPGAACPCR